MSIFYLDASAWVKYYVDEPGSRWVDQFWSQHPACACSDLGLVEVLATLARRQKRSPNSNGLYDQALLDVQRQYKAIQAIPVDEKVLTLACQCARSRALRGADSVHLASAIHLRNSFSQPVTFIASDAELLAAALIEGFPILDPARNPSMPELT